jgi:hypothetical protein
LAKGGAKAMMPKSKNPIENAIVNILAYGLMGLIALGFILMFLNWITEDVFPWIITVVQINGNRNVF